jgi:hypothetical protein
MDYDPVALARWVTAWFHRFERAGLAAEEAARQISEWVREREIPIEVVTMAMFLVDLDAAADALFTELGAPPALGDGFGSPPEEA